jgi:hypothetical protein
MSEMHLRLAKAVSETASSIGPTPAGVAGHDVHFYGTDDELTNTASEFLAEGVRVGQPIVVIATEAHRRSFASALRSLGLDPDELLSDRLAVWLDARETLASFMEHGKPNRELFIATVGSVFEQLIDRRHYLVIRGYGEMVDLLWQDGNADGAMLLEELWNELAERYKYSLLCGYSLDNFLHEAGVSSVTRICRHHHGALPLDLGKHVA